MYYLYVAVFGAIGAAARYWISITFETGNFPYDILCINILGSFLLAMTLRYLATVSKFSHSLITGIGIGLIGSFTTFSTFSAQVTDLLLREQYITAAVYILSSLIGGFLAAALGVYVSNRLITRKELKENA